MMCAVEVNEKRKLSRMRRDDWRSDSGREDVSDADDIGVDVAVEDDGIMMRMLMMINVVGSWFVVNRGITFEKGERIVDVGETEARSKCVKVNINFVSRGGPDRAACVGLRVQMENLLNVIFILLKLIRI